MSYFVSTSRNIVKTFSFPPTLVFLGSVPLTTFFIQTIHYFMPSLETFSILVLFISYFHQVFLSKTHIWPSHFAAKQNFFQLLIDMWIISKLLSMIWTGPSILLQPHVSGLSSSNHMLAIPCCLKALEYDHIILCPHEYP